MEASGEVTREKTRIYVGGLGGAVTEDDLRKTFSTLGEVVAVEVVRTKGRSFAYLDFLPSSDKSLPKLFSTYNGCMWKGGKLRLEKAKEHYLLRLRREWQEDAEHASKVSNGCNADASESHATSVKPKKPSSAAERAQLRIFFPKLQKVKSLGSVGIGKHKYSFQRVQVPSTPTHFCDCEEHSLPFVTITKKQSSEYEDASSGINEQELHLMNSVMNKIFERENPSKKVIEKSESVNGRGISMNSNDECLDADSNEEDHLTDEDNLIINVANGKSDSMDLLGEMKNMMANREPVANRLKTSNEKPKKAHDSLKKKNTPLSKKRKSPHPEENGKNAALRNSHFDSNIQENSKTEVEPGTKQLGSNSLRSLKSTWKDLIGPKGHTPFSISDIISTVPQEKQETLTKNEQDPKKKSLPCNKKRKSDGAPETTSSTLNINKEEATEAKEMCIPNDSERKMDELSTDIDLPLTTTTSESDVNPSGSWQKEDENENADRQKDLIQLARGESWRHKSSWTQLISGTHNNPFSISQVVPNLSFEKHEDNADAANKNLNDRCSAAIPTEQMADAAGKNEVLTGKKASEQKRMVPLLSLDSEETCAFMRTEESMKEWRKAKASLDKKKRSVQESA